MANTIKTVMTYDLDGTITDFNIPFEYLARKFVVVTLIGADRKVLVLNTDYRFVTKTTISTTKAWGPADGYQQIEVRRYTSATERLVDFTDGSILRAYDLNISQVQTLHVAEEARDLTADTIGVNNDGDLDARGRKIVNVADATEAGDAVSFGQMQRFDESAYNSMLKAKTSETNAKTSETNAKTSETNAKAEADRAKTEADRTNGKADEAATSASSAASSASTATQGANTATTKAAEAKGYADRLDDFVTIQDRINSVAVSQVGDVEPHVSRIVAKPGTVYGDGQLLSRAVHPTLWAKVNSGEVPVVDEAVWQSTPGKRGCYTKGTDGTNFRVPDYNGVSVGSIKAPVLRGDGGFTSGDIQKSGIPNVYGKLTSDSRTSYQFLADGIVEQEGALSAEGPSNKQGIAGDSTTAYGYQSLTLDASRNSDVYQNGLTEARMNSVVIVWVIRTHGVVNNPGSVDAAVLASRVEQVYTELNTKVGVLENNAKIGKRVTRQVFSQVNSFTTNRPAVCSEDLRGKLIEVLAFQNGSTGELYSTQIFRVPDTVSGADGSPAHRIYVGLSAWLWQLRLIAPDTLQMLSAGSGTQAISYINVIADFDQ